MKKQVTKDYRDGYILGLDSAVAEGMMSRDDKQRLIKSFDSKYECESKPQLNDKTNEHDMLTYNEHDVWTFQCKDDEGYEWDANICDIMDYGSYIYVHIEACATSYRVLFGIDCEYGLQWMCLPDWDVGCTIADYREIMWNAETLSRLTKSTCDGYTLAYAIYALKIQHGTYLLRDDK